jgi:predicted dehydrogenase
MVTTQPGSHNWAAAFAAVAATGIVAVYDAGEATRRQFVDCWAGDAGAAGAEGIAAYDDFERLLTAVRPDILCLATRQTQHAAQVEAAVAAGVRGILCDKPLATSLAEVERIVSACREANVPLAFGLDRRWMGRYRWARAVVAGGAVGTVNTVIAFGLQNLINHGCHWYDVALSLAGDPEVAWVSGAVDDVSGEPPESNRRLDPSGRAQIGLANGATLYVTPDGKPGLAFEVLGDRGRLLLLNDGREAYLWQAAAAAGPLRLVAPEAAGLPAQPETPAGWEAGPNAVADLVAAVRSRDAGGGAGAQTACDVAAARRASEIGFAVHASGAAGGKRVTVDEVDRGLRIPSFLWGNE